MFLTAELFIISRLYKRLQTHLLQYLLQVVVSLGRGVLQLCDESVNFVENKTRFDTLHPRLLEHDLSLTINERKEKEEETRRKTREEKEEEREEERKEKREVHRLVGILTKKMSTEGTAYLRAYSLHCVHYYNGPITQTNSSRNLLDGCMCTHIHVCVYV